MSEAGPSGSAQKHKNYKSNRGVEAGAEDGDEAEVGAGEVIVQREGVREADEEEEEVVVVVVLVLDGLCAPGIIVTAVMHKERSAEKELIHFLETIADEVYPETIEAEVKREDGAEDDLDLEEMLKRELAGMGGDKKSKRFPPDTRRGDVRGYDPSARADRAGVVKQGFETEDGRGLKFAIHTNSRNSDRLDRLDMIKRVADEVVALGNGHTVDLKSPDRTVLVEVNKNLLGISVVQDYERFRKYNVSAVAEAAAKAQHAASADPAQTTQTTDTVVVPVSTDPSAPASGPSAETSPEQKKNIKHQNRAQAAAKLAEAYKASASVPLEVGTKRKAEEMEAGEVPPEEQVEKGELVEQSIVRGATVSRDHSDHRSDLLLAPWSRLHSAMPTPSPKTSSRSSASATPIPAVALIGVRLMMLAVCRSSSLASDPIEMESLEMLSR
ncbi:hypothetical protein EHS25_003074 [Saitozyma podzolica]|uniref:THUMP domain-containing protein n=1 Tax=Saitozyma podzolica TaxID=1890683 RepID=A0A427YCQ0_9TREE|nr:hypothetical protein EHS25_003074 [Saitozyma podzolica]